MILSGIHNPLHWKESFDQCISHINFLNRNISRVKIRKRIFLTIGVFPKTKFSGKQEALDEYSSSGLTMRHIRLKQSQAFRPMAH
ncbi:MAG TPA: hypothetical protein DET40_13635 [Lentisphaeria bacterium]|nr:MAG: hypothetical protein A2X45_09535 [Lentisphaerae bacterium GWF2_50_93]HCE44582.1 hypothetical protein [Lentisphaeria bacterium]